MKLPDYMAEIFDPESPNFMRLSDRDLRFVRAKPPVQLPLPFKWRQDRLPIAAKYDHWM